MTTNNPEWENFDSEEIEDWMDPVEPDFFEDIDENICQCCGEIDEHIFILEDTDFDSLLNVCEKCKFDLMDEEPGRWREVSGLD